MPWQGRAPSWTHEQHICIPRPPSQGRVIGIARRFGWDLTLTRVLTVVAAFFAGSVVLIYIVLWIVVPEE